MTQSLWQIPDITNLRTPLSILREQANFLSQQTNSVLKGIVNIQPTSSDSSMISLLIQVPALNTYHFQVLMYNQPMTIYPGRLTAALQDVGPFNVVDEHSLLEGISLILSSEKTKKILESLLAQALSR